MFGAPPLKTVHQIPQRAARRDPASGRPKPSRRSPTHHDLVEVDLHPRNFGQGDGDPLQTNSLNTWRDVLHDHPRTVSRGTRFHLRPHIGAKSCDHRSANDAAQRGSYPKAPIHRFNAYLINSPSPGQKPPRQQSATTHRGCAGYVHSTPRRFSPFPGPHEQMSEFIARCRAMAVALVFLSSQGVN